MLKDAFTMGGRVELHKYYLNEAYLGGAALQSVWTRQLIEEKRGLVRQRYPILNYENDPLYKGLDIHATSLVSGKRGLVIGSETPWAEAMLLEYGAANITTVEFGSIISDHPNITTYVPSRFTTEFLLGMIPPFDFAFSYSSLEHDGLGRYGDVLNPDGDLLTMAKLLKLVRPGGTLFLGVPCCVDQLYWNAHRVYGFARLPYLLAGWHVLGLYCHSRYNLTIGSIVDQPLWVLQNTQGCSHPPEPVVAL